MYVYASVSRLGAGESEKSYKADDPLSKAIIAKKGDTSPEAFKEYAKVIAAMGATAACAAFSGGAAAAASPLCGVVASVVIGWAADKIPVAKGSTMYDVVAETWKSWIGPNLKWAQEAMLAVKAYYVMRDEAISAAVAAGAKPQWAEDYLNAHELTVEPIKGVWAPMKERYTHPLVCAAEPCAPIKDVPGVNSNTLKECAAAGMDCRTYLMLTYGPWPPVAGKDEAVDWGLVGWDEIMFRRQFQKKYGNCNLNAFNSDSINRACTGGLPPSEWARQKLIKLAKVKAKMIVDATASTAGTSEKSTVAAVGTAAAVVGAGWLAWKYVLPMVTKAVKL